MNSQSDDSVNYLTSGEIYELNNEIMGDESFIRDLRQLDYAARRPSIVLFGQPQFPTLVDKAAALLHSVAYHHLFADGNKRTASRALRLFLARNQYHLTWDPVTEADFILKVAKGDLTVEEIAATLALFIESKDRF